MVAVVWRGGGGGPAGVTVIHRTAIERPRPRRFARQRLSGQGGGRSATGAGQLRFAVEFDQDGRRPRPLSARPPFPDAPEQRNRVLPVRIRVSWACRAAVERAGLRRVGGSAVKRPGDGGSAGLAVGGRGDGEAARVTVERPGSRWSGRGHGGAAGVAAVRPGGGSAELTVGSPGSGEAAGSRGSSVRLAHAVRGIWVRGVEVSGARVHSVGARGVEARRLGFIASTFASPGVAGAWVGDI